jgi:hypothetical protein
LGQQGLERAIRSCEHSAECRRVLPQCGTDGAARQDREKRPYSRIAFEFAVDVLIQRGHVAGFRPRFLGQRRNGRAMARNILHVWLKGSRGGNTVVCFMCLHA